MKKRVSVIMPCYNDGAFIEESIQSVIKQTYPEVELLVIDDGSDDETTARILQKVERQKLCTVLRTKHVGVAGARNYGVARASGTYILPLDADDIISSTYIEKAVQKMEEDQRLGIVYCYADLFGEATGRWDLPNYSFQHMLRDNIIFITAMFYKKDWEAVGGFNANMVYGMEDYDFWLSIMELNREVFQIPEVLFHYRIKKRSRTTSLMDDMDNVKQMYRQIYKNHPAFYTCHRDAYAQELRDALIEQIFLRRALMKTNDMYECIKGKHPVVCKLIKRLIK